MKQPEQRVCPHCEKAFAVTEENHPYRPFCSRRCKMADLGRWLQEKYVVEGEHAANDVKMDDKE